MERLERSSKEKSGRAVSAPTARPDILLSALSDRREEPPPDFAQGYAGSLLRQSAVARRAKGGEGKYLERTLKKLANPSG